MQWCEQIGIFILEIPSRLKQQHRLVNMTSDGTKPPHVLIVGAGKSIEDYLDISIANT
jgi:hypothetical protein